MRKTPSLSRPHPAPSSAPPARPVPWFRALGGVVLLAAFAVLAGCGQTYPEMVKEDHAAVAKRLDALAAGLKAGRIRNATILKQYAQLLARQRPELKTLAKELVKEGTTEGLAFTSLRQRLDAVKLEPKDKEQAAAALDQLTRIEAAVDPKVFSDSLIDVVNVLADLSRGKLARLNVPASQPRPQQGAGSHLVGNPRYGNWRRDSSGNSFWVFFGSYALMRGLFMRPGPYYYQTWYPNRGWSYYGDVGRHYYGGRSDAQRWNRAAKAYPSRPRKTYGSLRSQQRLSTYGRTAARSSGGALRRTSSYAGSSRGTSPGARRAGRSRGK